MENVPVVVCKGRPDSGRRYRTLPDLFQAENPNHQDRLWQQDSVWQSHVQKLRDFPRPVSVLELCGGLSSGFIALKLLLGSDKAVLAGYYDGWYELRRLVGTVHGDDEHVHIGPDSANILMINVDQFPACDILFAGPPCPPWSDLGSKKSFSDPRAAVFWKTVDIVIFQGCHRQLMSFVLENVEGIMKVRTGTAEAPVKLIVRRLQEGLGQDFDIEVLLLNTYDFGLPQSRPRVFIVGRRKAMFTLGRPPPIMPFAGQVALSSIFQVEGVRPQKEYTEIEAQNIKDFKEKCKSLMQDPGQRGKYMVVDVSRTPSTRTSWGSGTSRPDHVQCLTASGPKLHAFALGEGSDGVLSIDRMLDAKEHGRLQGFPYCTIDASERVHQHIAKKAFGNAVSIPVIGSVLARELLAYQRTLGIGASASSSGSRSRGSGVDASDSATILRFRAPVSASSSGSAASSGLASDSAVVPTAKRQD